MSASEPHARYDDPPPRFRWIPPLMLGLTLGAIAGLVLTFAVMRGTNQSSDNAVLVADRFDPFRVLDRVPGAEIAVFDTRAPLGKGTTGPAIRRRIEYEGTLPTPAGPDPLLAQIELELARAGGTYFNRGLSSSSDADFATRSLALIYSTRDHRCGTMDVELTVVGRNLRGTVLLAESR